MWPGATDTAGSTLDLAAARPAQVPGADNAVFVAGPNSDQTSLYAFADPNVLWVPSNAMADDVLQRGR